MVIKRHKLLKKADWYFKNATNVISSLSLPSDYSFLVQKELFGKHLYNFGLFGTLG